MKLCRHWGRNSLRGAESGFFCVFYIWKKPSGTPFSISQAHILSTSFKLLCQEPICAPMSNRAQCGGCFLCRHLEERHGGEKTVMTSSPTFIPVPGIHNTQSSYQFCFNVLDDLCQYFDCLWLLLTLLCICIVTTLWGGIMAYWPSSISQYASP